jgi:glycosyltransferase involved in cell wall biosynthesis
VKILWIARTCPFPPNDGEKLRMFHLLKAVAQHHELTLVCRVMTDEQQAGLEELRKFCTGGVFGIYVPPPRNMLERLRWLLPFVFSRYPVALCIVYFRRMQEVLAQLGRTQHFDVVQIEHSSLTIYLDKVKFAGNPALILTMHNIDYLRNERIIDITPFGLTKFYHLLNRVRQKQWELQSLTRYDRVIAMSGLERLAMLAEIPSLNVDVIPNGVDCREVSHELAPAAATGLVFVASMDSEANHDGAMYFLDEVLPLIRQGHPAVTVAMVGRGPRAELKARHDGQAVVVTGQVDAVLPYYRQAAIAVVPLRSGGGTRLKILEAMAAGTPVVSTTVGAEGLDLVDGRQVLLADTPQDFAFAVGRLLNDAGLRAAISVQARQRVEQDCDWALLGERHEDLYRSVVRREHG